MPATVIIDLKNQVTGTASVCQTFAAATASHVGTVVDCQLHDGPTFGILQLGNCTGSGVTITCKLQECATTNGVFEDMTNGAFTVYTETTGDNILEVVNARRTKRYVRPSVVIAGTTSVTSVPLALTVIGQKKILGGNGSQTTE